jgi:hypothetical protein
MRKTREIGVTARTIDDDEIAGFLEARHAAEKTLSLLGFSLVEIALCRSIHAHDLRHRKFRTGGLHPTETIFEIPGEAALAHIKIDNPNLLAHPHQSDGQVHGDRRLARSTLFIAHDNDAGLALLR